MTGSLDGIFSISGNLGPGEDRLITFEMGKPDGVVASIDATRRGRVR